jgi:hypothetical protein
MSNENANPIASTNRSRLVDGPGLLEAIFEERSRPSLRWLRSMTKARVIPHIKIGRLVRYDVESVRGALEKRNCIKARF